MRVAGAEDGVDSFGGDPFWAEGAADGGCANGVGVFASCDQGGATTERRHETATERVTGANRIDRLDRESRHCDELLVRAGIEHHAFGAELDDDGAVEPLAKSEAGFLVGVVEDELELVGIADNYVDGAVELADFVEVEHLGPGLPDVKHG